MSIIKKTLYTSTFISLLFLGGTLVQAKDMHRLYNASSGEHFYTASLSEKNNLTSLGWKYEGIAWDAPETGDPVYRLYNPNSGEHHYTLSQKERDGLAAIGWKKEGTGWYSDKNKGVPIYRLYNPNARNAGAHHYTKSLAEYNGLKTIGWKQENIGWYGQKSTSTQKPNPGNPGEKPGVVDPTKPIDPETKPKKTYTYTALYLDENDKSIDTSDYYTATEGVPITVKAKQVDGYKLTTQDSYTNENPQGNLRIEFKYKKTVTNSQKQAARNQINSLNLEGLTSSVQKAINDAESQEQLDLIVLDAKKLHQLNAEPSYADTYEKQYQAKFLQLINEHRKAHGKQPLHYDSLLNNAALQRSKEIAQVWGHKRPNNDSFAGAIQDLFPSKNGMQYYNGWGENILEHSYKTDDPNELAQKHFDMWKNSPGHNENMLRDDYTCLGLRFSYNLKPDRIEGVTLFGIEK